MSGVVKGIKKAVKSVGRFVKKYWKQIVIAAAVVFTAGLATVGTAGFAAAASSAGGGFAGTMSAIGSTFTAGVASIGGSLGIGKGANLAAFGGAGHATLGTGAAAQALGFAPTGAAGAATAGNLAANAGAAGVGPSAAMANPGSLAAANTAAGVGNAANVAANAAGGAKTGGLMNFMMSPAGGVAMNAGIGLLQGYMQGRQMDDALKAQKPEGLWGVGLKKGNRSLSPEDFAGGGPQWSPDSWGSARTSGGLMGGAPSALSSTGNRALDQNYMIDPNRMNPLSKSYDPTADYIEGLV